MIGALDGRWTGTAFALWSLGVDSAQVMGLRMILFAGGGLEADREARRMVAEKVDAGHALGRLALAGALGSDPRLAADRVIGHYADRVRANRRRLSRV